MSTRSRVAIVTGGGTGIGAAAARLLAANVVGPYCLLAAALPSLRASTDAAVVNISSSVGSMVKPGTTLYGSTKAALEYLTRAWAYELASDGIRVDGIAAWVWFLVAP